VQAIWCQRQDARLGGALIPHLRPSDQPPIPVSPFDLQDIECFRGKIIPARMLYDTALLKDQRVLVLGGGKTSCGPLSLSPAVCDCAQPA
jgi:hypothetical protein